MTVVRQAESLGDKRLGEQAVKRRKVEAQQAVRRRETALFMAREAVVRYETQNTALLLVLRTCKDVGVDVLFRAP